MTKDRASSSPAYGPERCGDCTHWNRKSATLVTPGGRVQQMRVAACLAPVPASISRSHSTPMYEVAGAGCVCFARVPKASPKPRGSFRSGGNNMENGS